MTKPPRLASVTCLRRQPGIHKRDCGHVLVVGGSVGLSGAPVLCALGALRSGAGLVTLAVPESVYFITASQRPEIMVTPLPEAPGGWLSPAAVSNIAALAARKEAVALGPGVSAQLPAARLVRTLLPTISVPLVLDADGLNALAGQPALLRRAKAPVIVTPHPGEMARLTKRSIEAIQANRLRVAREAARQWRVIVVLKGHGTVVASPSGRTYVNSTGNPGMATGGMGDVLAGVIAALVGQGMPPFEAAVAGVYAHGLAGDLAAKAVGPVGLLATDVADRLPTAIARLIHGSR